MTSEQTVRSETPICAPHYLVPSVNQARTLDALINAIWSSSCLTLRDNTERPETMTIGTNELIGTDPSKLPPALT